MSSVKMSNLAKRKAELAKLTNKENNNGGNTET